MNEILPYEAIARQRRIRFNPLRALTPEWLASCLDSFSYGDVRQAALLWEAMAERDDRIPVAKSKRELAISLLDYEIMVEDDSPEAEQHKQTLEYFWANVTATNAYDRNVQGGFSTLVRQMMSAVSFKYAQHHIVWQPSTEGLTAKFEFVPLYFFENRTGKLRFTPDGISLDGVDLAEGEWITTVGDGVMIAASICYMFKRFSLQDWVTYNEKFGIPGLHAETGAAPGSAEWDAAVAAVGNFMNDWAAVTGQGTKFNLLEAKGGNSLPFAPLVEEMNRAIASLYRGADLSTMSAGSGSGEGASLQGAEGDTIEGGDAVMISEALQQAERYVIQIQHGARVPKAYIQVKTKDVRDRRVELETIKGAVELGIPVAVSNARARLQLPTPEDGEELIEKPEPPPMPGNGLPGRKGPEPGKEPALNERTLAANAATRRVGVEKFMATAVQTLSKATAEDLQALRSAVLLVAEAPVAEFPRRLDTLRRLLPKLGPELLEAKHSTAAMEKILGAALAEGLTTDNS